MGRRCTVLDYVIVKEDENLRGRAPGQVARVIREGLLDAGLSPDCVQTVYSEREAVRLAVEQMREQDLVVVLADDVASVLEQLQPLRTGPLAWRQKRLGGGAGVSC